MLLVNFKAVNLELEEGSAALLGGKLEKQRLKSLMGLLPKVNGSINLGTID